MRLTLILGLLSGAVSARAEVTWLAPDFFVDSEAPVRLMSLPAAECGGQLASKVCVVAEGRATEDRPCIGDGAKYGASLKTIYDKFSPALKSAFCSVAKVYIEPKLDSIAYAGSGKGGYVIGIRRSALDENLSFSKLLTWKEQIPFGGDKGSYDHPRADLPSVRASVPGIRDDAVFYVLAHELGHVVDFSRSLNATRKWTGISWLILGFSRYDLVFPLRRKIVFYDGPARLGPGDIAHTYDQQGFTDFITLYAATNPYDDFAETVAHASLLLAGGAYDVVLPDGRKVDSKDRLASDRFKTKREFVAAQLADAGAELAAKAPIRPLKEPPVPETSIPWDGGKPTP